MLCFLEAKTDTDNLLALEGFKDWLTTTGFTYMYCYWSRKDDCKAYGNEGVIVFSKVKCEKVTYGIGDPTMDKQARAATIEFSDCIIMFTYNPQGGFAEESLAFRTKWELQLSEHLQKTKQDAAQKDKKLIWAGDLNVNPYDTDWSWKAFDRIAKRIPENTKPAGCRPEDQAVYRKLISQIDGVNVAEHFNKPMGTCFQNENYLMKNAGQRIDHVIAERSLLEENDKLRITAFNTIQQFGAARKGSSDHCPLYCRLERGKPEQRVLTTQVETPPPTEDLCTLVLER